MSCWNLFRYHRNKKSQYTSNTGAWSPPARMEDMENSTQQPPSINPSRHIRMKQKHYRMCGCLSVKLCIFILILFLIALGITAFFLYPRIPQVKQVHLSHLTDPLNAVSFDGVSNLTIDSNYTIDATIFSPNYIPWKITMLSIIGRYNVGSAYIPLGSGGLSNFVLQAKKNSALEIPFSIEHSFSISQQDLASRTSTDPILTDIFTHCRAGPDATFPISLELAVNVFPLHPFGYDPTFQLNTEIKCPSALFLLPST